MSGLTHFDAAGNAVMVDVTGKDVTARTATAEGRVHHGAGDARADRGARLQEGRRAGRGAARRDHGRQAHGRPDPALPSPAADARSRSSSTPEPEQGCVVVRATCRVTGRTGVEMEALTAVAVAALTVYDMCKAVDRGMRIERHAPRPQGRRALRRVPGGRLRCCRSPRRRRASWPRLTPTPAEWVALPQALGRVLAGDLHAKRDQPPVAVSAMDGYAVRAADTAEPGRPFRLVGEAPAGGELGRRWSARRGRADLHRRRGAARRRRDRHPGERRPPSGDAVRFSAAVSAGTFVRPAGLDFRRGWAGLAAGTLLDARGARARRLAGPSLAAGAAAAADRPARHRQRAALARRDARRQPDRELEHRDCSAAMLAGWGAEAGRSRHLPGRGRGAGRRACARRAGLDLLVTTGGASVGDYDLVQQRARPRGHDARLLEDRDAAGQAAAVRPAGRGAGPGLSRQPGLHRGLRHRVSARGPAEDARPARRAAAARGGTRQRAGSPTTCARTICGRAMSRARERRRVTDGGAAGQLDAGDLRARRRAGGPAALRSRPAARRDCAR